MCISCVLLHNKSFQLSNLKCSDLLLITILLFGCAIVLLVSPGFTHTVAFRRGVSGLELDFPAHSLSPTRGLELASLHGSPRTAFQENKDKLQGL